MIKWTRHKILPWWFIESDQFYGLVQRIEPSKDRQGCWFSEVGQKFHVRPCLPISWLYHNTAREAFRNAEKELQKLTSED